MATPLPAEAQPPGQHPRIGYLSAASAESDKNRFAAFRLRLQELGYLEGKNIIIDQRYANGQSNRVAPLAAELVRLNVDVLVVYGGTPGTLAAKQATSSIPIVFTVVSDPVASGIVTSLARPGGNLTGLSDLHTDVVTKRLQLLKELIPSASRVAVLSNATNRALQRQVQDLHAAAPSAGMTVLSISVTGPHEIDQAFVRMRTERPGALIVLGDAVLGANRRRIAELALKSGVPTLFTTREAAIAGGLMSYGADHIDLWRRAATYVDKILKGAKPADLPVEQPTKFELVINLKTAKALSLTIPPSLRLQAVQVID